jgi:hypothetical protein
MPCGGRCGRRGLPAAASVSITAGVGMAVVVVVLADTDQRDLGSDRLKEAEGVRGATVVRARPVGRERPRMGVLLLPAR